MAHPLLAALHAAARGEFPNPDGGVTVMPALGGGLELSCAFTGHAIIATALSESRVLEQGPDGFGGSLAPDFLRWLAGPRGWIGVLDVTLVTHGREARRGAGPGPAALPRRFDLDQHPRVVLARTLRTAVDVYADEAS